MISASTLSTAFACSVIPSVQQIMARSARANACAVSPITSAGTPVSRSPSASVKGSTDAAYSSKPSVARSTKGRLTRPAWMISRAMAFESATSEPTSRPSHRSAHRAEVVRRGSMAYRRAPFRTPFRRWWKMIGCVSRAFEPQRRITSVSSISRYDDVPPPAPNTVARPTTLGACQVRLHESMLLEPMTWRASFCAR